MIISTTPWRTRKGAAAYAGVSESTIDRWVRDGKLKRHRVEGSRSVRFHTDDLDKLMIPETYTVGACQ